LYLCLDYYYRLVLLFKRNKRNKRQHTSLCSSVIPSTNGITGIIITHILFHIPQTNKSILFVVLQLHHPEVQLESLVLYCSSSSSSIKEKIIVYYGYPNPNPNMARSLLWSPSGYGLLWSKTRTCDLCAFLTIKDHNHSVTIKDHNHS